MTQGQHRAGVLRSIIVSLEGLERLGGHSCSVCKENLLGEVHCRYLRQNFRTGLLWTGSILWAPKCRPYCLQVPVSFTVPFTPTWCVAVVPVAQKGLMMYVGNIRNWNLQQESLFELLGYYLNLFRIYLKRRDIGIRNKRRIRQLCRSPKIVPLT